MVSHNRSGTRVELITAWNVSHSDKRECSDDRSLKIYWKTSNFTTRCGIVYRQSLTVSLGNWFVFQSWKRRRTVNSQKMLSQNCTSRLHAASSLDRTVWSEWIRDWLHPFLSEKSYACPSNCFMHSGYFGVCIYRFVWVDVFVLWTYLAFTLCTLFGSLFGPVHQIGHFSSFYARCFYFLRLNAVGHWALFGVR